MATRKSTIDISTLAKWTRWRARTGGATWRVCTRLLVRGGLVSSACNAFCTRMQLCTSAHTCASPPTRRAVRTVSLPLPAFAVCVQRYTIVPLVPAWVQYWSQNSQPAALRSCQTYGSLSCKCRSFMRCDSINQRNGGAPYGVRALRGAEAAWEVGNGYRGNTAETAPRLQQ